MARKNGQSPARAAWTLARRQHWVVTRQQLLRLGLTSEAVDWRIERGRLHPIYAGVYAVGRPSLTREGHFIAAVLASGQGAALSHASAAVLWEILPSHGGPLHVTVASGHPQRPGITIHRRRSFEVTKHRGIPVTTVACTIADVAGDLPDEELERAINEAANRDLTDPERLRDAIAEMGARPGARRVLRLLDRDTYVVTDTRLEQHLLRIARRAGLPPPSAQHRLPGGRVDLHWPGLGLIIEADSLRYHRTPAQQRADRLRDQRNAAAGLVTLRFTHWQVFREEAHVEAIVRQVARRAAEAA
jgi:very-short-patch-repair endonuclease